MFARFLALCLVLLAAVEATGQTIEYSYDGGTAVSVNSGVDFIVNVGTVTGTHTLRIYDPSYSTTPDDDAGKITINGSLGTVTYSHRRLHADLAVIPCNTANAVRGS